MMSASKTEVFRDCFLVDAATIKNLQGVFTDLEARERARIDAAVNEFESGLRQGIGTLDISPEREADILDRVHFHRGQLERAAIGTSITIDCRDKIRRELPSFDKLLEYLNERDREIRNLSISTPYGASVRCAVEFDPELSYRPVKYELRGDEEVIVAVSARLDPLLRSTAQWYSRLRRVDPAAVALAVMVMFFLAAAIAGVYLPDRQGDDGTPKYLKVVAVAMFFVTPIACGIAWNYGTKLFPRGVFAINEGQKRYKNVVFWRRVIGTAILIPIALEIAKYILTG